MSWPQRLNQKPNALEAWSRTKRSSLPVALWTRLQQRAFLTQDFNEPSKGLGLAEKKKKKKAKSRVPLISLSLIRQDLIKENPQWSPLPGRLARGENGARANLGPQVATE